jgi:hypothetical protein
MRTWIALGTLFILLTVPVSVFADGLTVTLTANGQHALAITPPTNYTLAWSSTNATSCTLSYVRVDGATPVSGSIDSGTNGSGPTGLIGTYAFTCTNASGQSVSDSVTITATGSSQSEVFTVSGNQLLRDNQPYTVKGLNVTTFTPTDVGLWWYDWNSRPFTSTNTRTTLLNAARDQWQANTIRIPVVQQFLDPEDSTLTAAQRKIYISDLDQAVIQSLNAGFSVIIAMWSQIPIPPSNDKYPYTGGCIATPATWRAWESLLPLVKEYPSVLPDLFNEPSRASWDVWKNGGTVACRQYQDSVLGMQTLLSDMRQAGVQNLLLVEPLDIFRADTNPAHLLSDPIGRTAYAIHPYPYNGDGTTDTYGLLKGSAFSTSTNAAILDAAFGNAAKSVPVIADEWSLAQYNGNGPAISCRDVPQMGYFFTAYLEHNLPAGSAPTGFDDPPIQLTSDLSYTPRGYANVANCPNVTDVNDTIGSVGVLVSAWYHGVDLWSSANPSVSISVQPSSVPSGTRADVSWSAANVSSCTYSTPNGAPSDYSFGSNVPLDGETGVGPITKDATYTITCDGVSKSATIAVTGTPPPTAAQTTNGQAGTSNPVNHATDSVAASTSLSCTPNWSCTLWNQCSVSGSQARSCTDLNACGTNNAEPALAQSCTYAQITGGSGGGGGGSTASNSIFSMSTSSVGSLRAQIASLLVQPTAPKAEPGNSTQSKTCPIITRTLAFGSRGQDVRSLQLFFTTQFTNFTSNYATGYFGTLTQHAVAEWQSEHGVVSSGSPQSTGWGVIGPKTRNAIATACQ